MQMMALGRGEAESCRTEREPRLQGRRPGLWSALGRGLAEPPEASRFAQFFPPERENLSDQNPLTPLAGCLSCWMEISRHRRVAAGEPLFS